MYFCTFQTRANFELSIERQFCVIAKTHTLEEFAMNTDRHCIHYSRSNDVVMRQFCRLQHSRIVTDSPEILSNSFQFRKMGLYLQVMCPFLENTVRIYLYHLIESDSLLNTEREYCVRRSSTPDVTITLGSFGLSASVVALVDAAVALALFLLL